MTTHSTEALTLANEHALAGRLTEMLTVCQALHVACKDDFGVQLNTGVLLAGFGFLGDAMACYRRAGVLQPDDARPLINQASLLTAAGSHREARALYATLLPRLSDHPVVRRNFLTSLEYDPTVSDSERLAQARAWGHWAIQRVGGPQPRPSGNSLQGRALRLGYLSPDFCQHTVGLFIKDVLKAHDPAAVAVTAYSAGTVKDWVTREIQRSVILHDVSGLDDHALARRIQADGIDVLVDLSGHTAGSRLTALVHRPAPVMVSWLGYFATTGLSYMDAVLLDEWHAPPGTETSFVEPIIRLKGGRFLYQPLRWAPKTVSEPPCLKKGYVTFGSFNNTAKLNDAVFDAWSAVLRSVPTARMVLKWRTFNDATYRASVLAAFGQRGVEAHRMDLQGPSFHVDLYKAYDEIDIALDPFPFTGGLTSCEALWMGVPVVTWPQSRVVSRQTFALLSAIGLQGLAATGVENYIAIASQLAGDPDRLSEIRGSLRQRMQASSLCDTAGFTRNLERALTDLYQRTVSGP